jgi:DNA polymerase-3 subunit alpha
MSESGSGYVPLHGHSYFSILDGLASPEDVAARAKELGHEAVALTDHGTCGGLLRFQKACESEGIKPILGSELYVVEDMDLRDKNEEKYHSILWAKNEEGYRNLTRLSSMANTRGFYGKPRVSMSAIKEHREGLMMGTACLKGLVAYNIFKGHDEIATKNLMMLQDIFGDDLYVEIMAHKYKGKGADRQEEQFTVFRKALALADKVGVKPIFAGDFHYCRPEDAEVQDLLVSIQTGNTVKNPERFSFWSDDFYMKSAEEVQIYCTNRPELMSNTVEVASKVEGGIIKSRDFNDLLPVFNLPPGASSEEAYLKTLIREGMIRRGIFDKPEYRKRISFELDIIINCNFVKYFLVLWDMVNFANQQKLRLGPGRGSGAASLCLYCLNVTQLDPLVHDLLFERFLNKDRVSPPDVDLDFDDSRRDEMFTYIASKYGDDHVSRIGTYGTIAARDTIHRAGKALDIGGDWEISGQTGGKWKSGRNTLEIVDQIAKTVPDTPGIKLADALTESRELLGYKAKYPKLFEMALKLEGTISSAGVHAAGAAVCRYPIADYIPLRVNKGNICSQYVMEEVEHTGLLKYDFLGLQTIRIIDICIRMISERRNEPEIDIDALTPDDEKTFALLNSGSVAGVFQFESGNAEPGTIGDLLKRIRVDSFIDMVVGVALFRPGTPKEVRNLYVDYKHGRKKVEYVHPLMEELFSSTYGIMCFQEDIMKISMEMAGFDGADADYFRKGIGKKKPEIIEKLKPKFIDGAVGKGVSTNVAEKVFALCETFGGYGFNKAHSAAYALIGYQTAWLKAHYPREFMSALLTVNVLKDDKRNWYQRECKKMGIKVFGPHVNHSKTEYTIEEGGIRTPMVSIKGVGAKAADNLVAAQPFENFVDFVGKIDGRVVNKKVFECLVSCGAMDCLGMTKKTLLEKFEDAKKEAKKKKDADKKAAELEKSKVEAFGVDDLFSASM